MLTDAIAQHPDTHSGVHLRRFLWSLYNGHHALNLGRMKDVLDRRHNAAVVEVFTAWMQGQVSEDALHHALTVSGGMDRWDAVTLGAKDRERLDDAVSAVTDLLNTVPPRPPHPRTHPRQRPAAAGGRLPADGEEVKPGRLPA